MFRRGNTSLCRSCQKDVSSIPGPACQLKKHAAYRIQRVERFTELRTHWHCHWRQRIKVLRILGGKCRRCGNEDWRVLQINHKNGGGHEERSSRGMSGAALVRAILNGRKTDDLDVLCANCNVIHEYERGRLQLPKELEKELVT